MIIKGRARAGGSQLAAYLLNRDGSERAEILEMRGLNSFGGNIRNALIGMEIDAKASGCEKPLYHASFRLEEGAELTPEQWREAADRLEKKLGMEGHERALIMHEGEHGKHLHVVWNRIDQDTAEPTRLEFDAYKRLDVARELERDFHTRELSNEHTQDHPNRADYEQAKRQGRDIHDIKAELKAAYERSDNGAALENALADAGYILAKGDKRDFVAVDKTGQEYTIGKRLTGATAAQIRAKTADLDRDLLPTAEQAKEYQQQREQARADREREEKHRAEVKALTAEILRKTAALKAEKARQNPEHQPQQQPAQAEKEHGHDTPEPLNQAQENTPQQQQEKPRFRFDPTRQQFTLVEPQQGRTVMTPEELKTAQEHAKTPEGQKEREAADREARKTAQARTILEAGEKAQGGLDLANRLEEKDFILAKKDKGGYAAVHISGMVHTLTLDKIGWTKEQAADRFKEWGHLGTVEQARAMLPDWRKEKAEERAQEQATREAATQAKAIEKRDEADARAKEKGQTGLLNSRALVRDARKESENGKDFAELLKGSGFELVNSGKEYRPYAIVDHKGRTLDIAYTLGETAKATKEALKDLDPATLRTAKEVQAEVKAHAQAITQAAKDGQKWQECQHAPALQAKENAKPPNIAPEKPKEAAPNIGRAAGAIGDSVLRLADGLLGGLAGPVTHEQIRQQAAGTQQRTAEQVRDAAQQFKQPLTPQEREAKAREFDRAAAEATRARDAYKAAHANARGDERSRIRRAEFRANIEAREAAQQAALLRETEQQRQEREAKEREEREAERRSRERQRER